LKTEEYDFSLPPERIALYPPERRVESRLLIVQREPFRILHRRFYQIVTFLQKGDILVLNKTRVLKARLLGKRKTGGKVEILITEILGEKTFKGLVRPGKKAKEGELLFFPKGGQLVVESVLEGGERVFRILEDEEPLDFIEREGEPPIPPYIKRKAESLDEKRYQTVFAETPGSIAAPTAGFHFSRELLDELEAKGVKVLYLVLHVGLGTFRPIKSERIEDHRMEREYYIIPAETREEIEEAVLSKRRVIAVGTSVTRALESWGLGAGPARGPTDLFIYPPYRFKVVNALVTNFHLPRSTNLLLVAALLGKERLFEIYNEAIEKGYRFYTYGDAMFVI